VTGAATPTPGPGSATVTVAGAGAATAVPDTAVLELGVESRGPTPAEALDACARALDQVLAALDAEGVPPARRTTGGLQLQEDWESRQPGRGPVAYLAGARLTVRLAGLALGPVLEIREAPPPPPDARPMRLLAAAATPTAPAVEPGETVVCAAVTVTWSLRSR
jgi:uncharacterized protein YggE